MSVIPRKKKDPESGSLTSCKQFIFNNMAERVGFDGPSIITTAMFSTRCSKWMKNNELLGF
jgi:hypothetical protein